MRAWKLFRSSLPSERVGAEPRLKCPIGMKYTYFRASYAQFEYTSILYHESSLRSGRLLLFKLGRPTYTSFRGTGEGAGDNIPI